MKVKSTAVTSDAVDDEHTHVVLQLERRFAVASLRVGHQQERLPSVMQAAAQAHALVVGKVEAAGACVGGEIEQQRFGQEMLLAQ